MWRRFERFDVFPKTLDDFREQTVTGAIVSVITALFVCWLFYSELSIYLAQEVDPELFVDTERAAKIRINLDVYFPDMPCAFLTLDAVDSAGELQLDLAHNVFKKRMRNGQPIAVVREEVSQRVTQQPNADTPKQPPVQNTTLPSLTPEEEKCGSCYGAQTHAGQCCNTCEEVREAYRQRGWAFQNAEAIVQCVREKFPQQLLEAQGEGCQVYGYLLVNKVAGNFHFSPGKSFQSAGAHVHDYALFKQTYFNLSHTISYLSFGMAIPGIVKPLDHVYKHQSNAVNQLFQYYIKVVPTIYKSVDGSVLKTNQFSVTEHQRELGSGDGHGVPGVFFMYDLSPITVSFNAKKASFASFLTSVCAIIGGVFTVSSFIDALIYHGQRAIKRKSILGDRN